MWGIAGPLFKKVLREINTKEKSETLYFLERITFLQQLESYQKEQLANYAISQQYNPGQVIVNKGEQADSFFLIKRGVVSCYDGTKFIRDLFQDHSFGEQALYEDRVRGLTVIAKNETQCLALARKKLLKVLGDNIQNVFFKNSLQWALANHKLFGKLNQIQKFRWINNASMKKIRGEKTLIEEQNSPLVNIYIVVTGELKYGE